jgi:hypothetical protein
VLNTKPVDWRLAAALLQRSVELGNTDSAVLAQLALAHAGGVLPARVEPPKPPVVAKAKPKAARKTPAWRRRWR